MTVQYMFLGTECKWSSGQMHPFPPPEDTTSALKVAVRHSRHRISVSQEWRAIEREERETGMMYPYLSHSLSRYLHLSFSLPRTGSSCHKSSCSLSVAPGCSYTLLLFLSCCFALRIALPLCISLFASAPCCRAALCLFAAPVTQQERNKTKRGGDPQCCDCSYEVSENCEALAFILLFDTERNKACYLPRWIMDLLLVFHNKEKKKTTGDD